MTAIFLDRDGVVIRKAPEGEYVVDTCEVEFLPGSLQAIADFCHAGYKVMIVTNQRGVATGKIRLSNLNDIHKMLRQAVASYGGNIAGTYCCTHDLSENCTCRKPRPGMLFQAATEHGLNLPQCWMVGDSATDIAAGKSAGCKTALIAQSEECRHWTSETGHFGAELDWSC